MNDTISGSIETHQEVYEWWRNKKEELARGLKEARVEGKVEQEVLDVMEGLLEVTKVKISMEEYLEEN